MIPASRSFQVAVALSLVFLPFVSAPVRAEGGKPRLQALDPAGKRIRGLVVEQGVEIEPDGDGFKLVVRGSLLRKGGVALGGEEVLAKSDSDDTPAKFEWKTVVPRSKPELEILVVDSSGKNLIGRFGLKGELPQATVEEKKAEPETKAPTAVDIVPLGDSGAIRWKKGRVAIVEEDGKRYARFRGKLRDAGALAVEGVGEAILPEGDKRDFEWKAEIGELPMELVFLRQPPAEKKKAVAAGEAKPEDASAASEKTVEEKPAETKPPEPEKLRYCVVAEGKYEQGVSCQEAKTPPGEYPIWRLTASFGGDSYEDSVVAPTSQMALRLRGARWFGLLCGGACRARVEGVATAISFGGTSGPVRFAAVRARGEFHWQKGLWAGVLGAGEVLATSFSADYGFSPLYFPEFAADFSRAVGTAGARAGAGARFGVAPGGSQIAIEASYSWPVQAGGASWNVGFEWEKLSKENGTGMIHLSSWGVTIGRTWF